MRLVLAIAILAGAAMPLCAQQDFVLASDPRVPVASCPALTCAEVGADAPEARHTKYAVPFRFVSTRICAVVWVTVPAFG